MNGHLVLTIVFYFVAISCTVMGFITSNMSQLVFGVMLLSVLLIVTLKVIFDILRDRKEIKEQESYYDNTN